MASGAKKISQLPDADALDGSEFLELSQSVSGALASRRATAMDLAALVNTGVYKLDVVNGGFEAATDLDGWTITKGSPTAGAVSNNGYPNLGPYKGSKFLKHANSDSQDFEVEQSIDVAGAGTLLAIWFGAQTSSLDDIPYIECEFFDSADTSLGAAVRDGQGAGPLVDTWYRHVSTFTAPADTAYVKLRAGGEYHSGTIVNAGIDEVSGFFFPATPPSYVTEAPDDGNTYVRQSKGWTDGATVYAAKVKNNLAATTDPGASDDESQGYAQNSNWFNTTSGEVFKCMDAATGAAVWVKTTLTLDELGSAATKNAGTGSADLPTNTNIDDKYRSLILAGL